MTAPEIIAQFHELILDDRRISAKWIAEQLGYSRVRVGSVIHEDSDMRSSPRSGSENARKWIRNVNGASRQRKFRIFFPVRSKWFCVAIGGHGRNLLVSLKPGIKATMNGVALWWPTPFQKIQGAKICWESFRLDCWIKAASSSLINFQIAKISTRCFTNRCWSHLWDI